MEAARKIHEEASRGAPRTRQVAAPIPDRQGLSGSAGRSCSPSMTSNWPPRRSARVRDRGLLESALARPRPVPLWRTLDARLAASYAFGISRNHPFLDGNKRHRLVVAELFLGLNGFGSPPPTRMRDDLPAAPPEDLAEEQLAERISTHSTVVRWVTDAAAAPIATPGAVPEGESPMTRKRKLHAAADRTPSRRCCAARPFLLLVVGQPQGRARTAP